MTVKIDKGVVMPGPAGNTTGGRGKWPWHEMQPGDSFFAAGYVQTLAQRTAANEPTINTSGGLHACSGTTWATRRITESGVRGVRVWRVT